MYIKREQKLAVLSFVIHLYKMSFRLVRFDPLGHNLLTAIVNPSNQQVRNLSLSLLLVM